MSISYKLKHIKKQIKILLSIINFTHKKTPYPHEQDGHTSINIKQAHQIL